MRLNMLPFAPGAPITRGRPAQPHGQAYYDSIFRLYAQWGVDYVKVDDIAYNALEGGKMIEDEVIMIHRAIDRCGRDMILSLSPGPAPIDQSRYTVPPCDHVAHHRDLWDRWEDMVEDMERCAQWAPYVGQGSWPDADMLLSGTSVAGGQ